MKNNIKIVNEFYAVFTMNDIILLAQYADGSIEKEYEWHKIGGNKVEVVGYSNRDKNGNYFTTSKIVKMSDNGLKEWEEEYKNRQKTKEQIDKEWKQKHLIHLAECERYRRENGTYKKCSKQFAENSIKRINKYISNRSDSEKFLDEYKIFIDSMRESLDILNKIAI